MGGKSGLDRVGSVADMGPGMPQGIGWPCSDPYPGGPPEPVEPTMDVMEQWLRKEGILGTLSQGPELERRYKAFSKVNMGEVVSSSERHTFLQSMLPYEHRLAATQYCIGLVDEPSL